ncbi:MAG: M1 family metallopeptidase [Bacteroidota bacterium]
MKLNFSLTAAFFFCWWGSSLQAQAELFPNPLSPRTASYDISVELDTTRKMIYGQEKLYWHNPSGDTVRELRFHLYYNAYRNNYSTWLKDSRRSAPFIQGEDIHQVNYWGWSKIEKMTDAKGNDLTKAIEFIQPNDDNEHDRTVIRVPLKEPVLPYQRTTVDIEFTAKIPVIFARTGYNRDYYFMVQWFPKLGVYEPAGMRFAKEGQWNCHQFHSQTEFYADFGLYNIDITLPANMVVGASGVLQSVEDKGALKTYYYRAEDVIDFAWTASPGFVEVTDKWKSVDIRVLVYPQHYYLADRNIKALKQSLEYFDQHIGEYPYSTLTIVIPPLHGIGSSGMEYPTLITTTGLYGIPNWLRTPEILTVHEFIHQYFMQMVASNEQEEAWLDEGLTSYFEGKIMDKYYGEKESTFEFIGFHAGAFEFDRGRMWSLEHPQIAEVARPAWEFVHGGYSTMSYTKPMLWLRTLEGLVGEECMMNIMRTYFQRWKFKHPCGTDFTDVVNEVVKDCHGDRFGPDMNWFFDQVLYGTEVCDYAVASISNELRKERNGVFGADNEWVRVEQPGQGEVPENAIYESEVILHRRGDMIIPVEVVITFENGEQRKEWWNGKDRSYGYNYSGPSKVHSVAIDPENKNYMDRNFINNSLVVEQPKTGILKYGGIFMMWVQNIMQSTTFLI